MSRRPSSVSIGVLGTVMAVGVIWWGLTTDHGPVDAPTDPIAPIVAQRADLGRLLAEGVAVRCEERAGPGQDARAVKRKEYFPRRLTPAQRREVSQKLDHQIAQSYQVYRGLLEADQTPEQVLKVRRQWEQVVAVREARRLFDLGTEFLLPATQYLHTDQDWFYYNTPIKTGDREWSLVYCAIDMKSCDALRVAREDLQVTSANLESEVAKAWNSLGVAERKERYQRHVQLSAELTDLSRKIEQQYELDRMRQTEWDKRLRQDANAARGMPGAGTRAMSQEYHDLVKRQKVILETLARNPSQFNQSTYQAVQQK